LAEDVGPDKVNLSKDVFPKWAEQTGKGSTMMDRNWKEVKNHIIDYLEKEQDIHLSKSQKNRLKVSQVVATMFMRKRFADWMLELVNARRS
jgi:hypothetical protein